MSRHRNIRNLTEDDYDDYYVSYFLGLYFRIASVLICVAFPAHVVLV